MKIWARILALTVIAFAGSTALAQQITATLVGTVTDTSAAAIPGAHVTATNTDTALTFSSSSDAQGAYRIDLLPVGHYEVKVEAQGFKTRNQKGIILDLGQSASLNVTLEPGSVNESVTVTSDVPLINLSNSVVGATVQNREIENLPLVNRNVYDLLSLVPGVQTNSTSYTLGYPQQTVLINGGVQIGTSGSTSFYLDGGTNMTGLRNTGNVQPNPDAVNEFRVETNNYTAEYGRFPNGVVNVITKSGTNKFHGSLFEFWRETALNAKDYNSTQQTPLHRHQFGGAIGGPIVKDKTFFFFSYGGLRQITTSFLNSAVVPTSAQRTGDFSANLPSDIGAINSCNQAITAADKAAGKFIVCNPTTRKPYAGNIITSPLDPTVQNLVKAGSLPFIPLPNAAGNIFQGYVTLPNNTNEALLKIDQSFSPNHRLTGEVFENSGAIANTAGGNLPWSTQNYLYRQWNGNLSDTYTFSPNLVNQAWVTYVRNLGGRVNLPAHQLSEYGSQFQVQGTPSLPQIAVSGYFTAGEAISGPRAGSNFYEVRDTLILTKGKHSIRFGGSAGLDKDIQESLLNNYGVFSFSATTSVRTGNALSDFILGQPATMNQDAPSIARMNSWYDGLYVMDDYRILPTLTLNLGLRWDYQTTPVDTNNQAGDFRAGQQSTVVPSAPVGVVFSGDKGVARGIIPNRYNHFSPRVGFAWDVFGDGKTSVRGGGGIFWGSISGNECCGAGQPFQYRGSFTNIQSITNPYGNYPGGSPFPFVFNPDAPRFTYPFPVSAVEHGFNWTSTYQANLQVEQQWTNTFATSIGYVGSLGRHLPFSTDINYPIYTPGALAATRDARRLIQPGVLQSITQFSSQQTSAYHALQITANKRMSHNLSLRSYYVWSKNWESVGMESSDASVVNPTKLYLERGRADNDYRHTFVTSFVWLLDYYHHNHSIVGTAVNGWQVSPIITLRSGGPFTVTVGSDVNQDGTNNDRPNLVGNPYLSPHRSRDAVKAEWFDPTAYTTPDPGVEGNSARDGLQGPGSKTVNAAFFRNFSIFENMQLQFRGEFTNLFNNVNLSNPTATLNSSLAGTIKSAGSMRQTQLGLRLTF